MCLYAPCPSSFASWLQYPRTLRTLHPINESDSLRTPLAGHCFIPIESTRALNQRAHTPTPPLPPEPTSLSPLPRSLRVAVCVNVPYLHVCNLTHVNVCAYTCVYFWVMVRRQVTTPAGDHAPAEDVPAVPQLVPLCKYDLRQGRPQGRALYRNEGRGG